MAMYLTRFSYTPETWARMIEKPEDRRDAARTFIEVGRRQAARLLVGLGEDDGCNLWEAPDILVAMSAVAYCDRCGRGCDVHWRRPFSLASKIRSKR